MERKCFWCYKGITTAPFAPRFRTLPSTYGFSTRETFAQHASWRQPQLPTLNITNRIDNLKKVFLPLYVSGQLAIWSRQAIIITWKQVCTVNTPVENVLGCNLKNNSAAWKTSLPTCVYSFIKLITDKRNAETIRYRRTAYINLT